MLKLFNKIVFSIKKNRSKILPLIVLGLLLLLTPVQSVRADLWGDILNAVRNIVTLPLKIGLIVGIIMTMIPLIIQGVMTFVVYLIVVLISRAMIVYSLNVPISPSSGAAGTIDIIVRSWGFVLGFVNMFFALTLTFIGLATILRLKDYEAKKLLPKLLIIAILVNFTPVIIGFIVDMGNLVTNFFVSKSNITKDTVSDIPGDFDEIFSRTLSLDAIGSFFNNLLSLIMGPFLNVLSAAINLLGRMLLGIVFLMYSIYIYICVTGMFFLRVIMLWILTILSPIAFFSYIFPKGSPFQKLFPDILHWEKWWEEFLKWVIVGIPFGLFLYISTAIFLSEGIPPIGSGSISPTQGVDVQSILDTVTEFFTCFVALMMLHQGYKISTAAAPAMAQQMIKGTEKLIKTAAMAVATMGAGALASGAGSALGGMGAKVGSVGGKLMQSKSGLVRGIGKGMNLGTKPLSKGLNFLGGKADLYAAKHKPTLPEGFDNLETDDKKWKYLKSGSKEKQLVGLEKMDIGKLSDENKNEVQALMEQTSGKARYKDKYSKAFEKGSAAGLYSKDMAINLSDDPEEMQEKINNKVDEIQDILGEKKLRIEFEKEHGAGASDEKFEEFKQNFAAKTLNFEKIKPANIKDLGKEVITSPAFKMASHQRSSKDLTAIEENFSTDVFEEFWNGEGGINKVYGEGDNYQKLMEKNERLGLDLLMNPRFGHLNFEPRYNAKIKHKTKDGADLKKIRAEMKKYKAEQSANPDNVKTPEDIHINPEELNKKIEDIKIKLGTARHSSPAIDSKTYKEADSTAKAFGLTGIDDSASPDLNRFLEGYTRAEAKRQLIKEKQELQKEPIDEKRRKRIEKEMPSMKAYTKERLEKKGATGVREKTIQARIKWIQERMDKKIAKKGSLSQKYASNLLGRNNKLNNEIKKLDNLVAQIKKIEKLSSQQPSNQQLESQLKDKQKEYKLQEKTMIDKRKEIEKTLKDYELLIRSNLADANKKAQAKKK